MSRIRASARVALAVSVLALLLLSAGATAAGYLVEARNQRIDLAHGLADAAAYVEHGATQAETTRWQQALARYQDVGAPEAGAVRGRLAALADRREHPRGPPRRRA